MTHSMAAPPEQFHFGLDYIREHFGSNVALATQQMTHNLYRTNLLPLVDHIFESLELTGRESLLDVGCGNGFVLRDIVSRMRDGGRVTALDISPAMLDLARRNVTVAWVPLEFTEGDAYDLSRFADGAFDRVMANFIFHYVDRPHDVLAELRRVTAVGGRALVTIEARHSMPEMYGMHFEAMERVGFPAEFIARLPRGRRGVMTLDNTAEYVTEHFDIVDERPYRDALRFTSPKPFMDFYVAGHRYCGALAKAGDEIPKELFDALHADVEGQVAARIARHGHFELTKRNSVFVCS
ncbi:methyltransferase domain-containing protein [Streptomyces sp. DSM 44915]|uniref:Methyltransferase domain-containing protein n=1 Tax=Streptomyces chisholmiae TaxID=3075540 RepID=A0ABU2JV78_9ACTN|nr:methyltransferase domain-containing protein [Streptomyces sp. DSM 44915]MDT0268656.1 methyltransferase domain-containing protein [Streptomyces sp. DSM 44915]